MLDSILNTVTWTIVFSSIGYFGGWLIGGIVEHVKGPR